MNHIAAAISKAMTTISTRPAPCVLASDETVAAKIISLAEDHGFEPDAQYVEPIRAYLSGYGLLLTGKAGVGKTFLLTCLHGRVRPAAEIVEYGLRDIRTFYEWTDGHDIFIDDLGTEAIVTEYGAKDDLMKAVIAHRAERQKGRTHVTSNMTAAEIAARYGDRTLSRLLGMCKVFTLTGANRRTPKQHGGTP